MDWEDGHIFGKRCADKTTDCAIKGPCLPRKLELNRTSHPPASTAQSSWSPLTFSIRAITGTPKGHRFSQLPQAMQSSAPALRAW